MLTLKQSFCRGILLLAALVWSVPVLRASVVLNSANFPDPIFRAYISQKTGVAEGGTLVDGILKQMRTIDVKSKGIESLKGIEYFTNLDCLSAPDNNLTEIDLSNNTLLKYAYLKDNSLSSIDVSNNVNLIELDVGNTEGKGYNKLFRLNLSNNPMLERVCCEYNNLTALVVSNLPKLRVLECRSNQLASLNLTNNPKLVVLDCRLNQLTCVNL